MAELRRKKGPSFSLETKERGRDELMDDLTLSLIPPPAYRRQA